MEFTQQQSGAIDAVGKWFLDKNSPQIFRLFGYAGTGKTYLAKHIAESLTDHVVYMAFTGKATMVLRKKGCNPTMTIHSAIYRPVQDQQTGEVHFEFNHESPVAECNLVVIDEVSMVGEDLAKDLMRFGVKILVLGDPAQLPPIGQEGYFINAEPDYMLTEVHRQAAENPIIRLSMDIRAGKQLKPGQYGNSRIAYRSDLDKDELKSIVLSGDQVLCGMNKTRTSLNAGIRRMKGLCGKEEIYHPTVGDKLICLKNNAEMGFMNGSMWEVTGNTSAFCYSGIHHIRTRVKSLDFNDFPTDIKVLDACFQGTENTVNWKIRARYDEFTFGEAITCHKSQGSQWDNVVLYDESAIFREHQQKWLYTAVTRAAEQITIFLG